MTPLMEREVTRLRKGRGSSMVENVCHSNGYVCVEHGIQCSFISAVVALFS